MCSCFDVNMVAGRQSMVLGSLSSGSVERAVQRVKSSEIEDVTVMEDTVGCAAEWSGDAAEDVGERESHHPGRGKWSRHNFCDGQSRSETVREGDFWKFLAEAEKEAVDPDEYLDMNDGKIKKCVRLLSFPIQSKLNHLGMRRVTR